MVFTCSKVTNADTKLKECNVYNPIAPSKDKWVGWRAYGHTTEIVPTYDANRFIYFNGEGGKK